MIFLFNFFFKVIIGSLCFSLFFSPKDEMRWDIPMCHLFLTEKSNIDNLQAVEWGWCFSFTSQWHVSVVHVISFHCTCHCQHLTMFQLVSSFWIYFLVLWDESSTEHHEDLWGAKSLSTPLFKSNSWTQGGPFTGHFLCCKVCHNFSTLKIYATFGDGKWSNGDRIIFIRSLW